MALSILCAGANGFAQGSSGTPETKSSQAALQPAPLQISQKEMKKLFVKKVKPGTDGSLRDAKLVSGHPIIAPSAMKAARESRYRPYLADGKPVEVEGEVEFDVP